MKKIIFTKKDTAELVEVKDKAPERDGWWIPYKV